MDTEGPTEACSNCSDLRDKNLARCMVAGDTVLVVAAACCSRVQAIRGEPAAEDVGIDCRRHGKEPPEASKRDTAERIQDCAALQVGDGRVAGRCVTLPAADCSSAGWIAHVTGNCSLFFHHLKT